MGMLHRNPELLGYLEAETETYAQIFRSGQTAGLANKITIIQNCLWRLQPYDAGDLNFVKPFFL